MKANRNPMRSVLSSVSMLLVILSLMFSQVSPQRVLAQSGDGLKREVNAESGRVSYISPLTGRSLPASRTLGTGIRPQDPAMALARRYAPEFGIKDPERELVEMKSDQDEAGQLVVRYQQNYQDVPVMGGELIVNTNENGDLYSMSGEVSPGLSLSTHPAIDAAQAKETALQSVAKWYGKYTEELISTEPALWIYDESLLQPSTRPVELTWRMEVTARDGSIPIRELVLVNAQRGGISLHFNQIDTAWAAGSGEPGNPARDVSLAPVPARVNTPATEAAPSTGESSPAGASHGSPGAASASTWYVAPAGNDSNTCTDAGSACLTIKGALEKATAGDAIHVAIGTYTDNNYGTALAIHKDITLSGGWDGLFSAQTGFSIIDGQNTVSGVSVGGAVVTIDHFIIQNGYGYYSAAGGGISQTGGNLMVTNSLIKNNQAPRSGGGGIWSYGGTLTIVNSSVISNTTTQNGGGVYLSNNGSATIRNSTVSGNTASNGYGGGIHVDWGNVTLENVTVASNTSNWGGGFYDNLPPYDTIVVRNTILAKNTASSSPDCAATLDTSDHNLIGNAAGCVIPGAGNFLNTDPLLSTYPLGTPGYYALMPGSPAINNGNPASCLPLDQRGMARFGTCDIGSYEYAAPGAAASFGVANGSGQRAAPLLPFAQLLAVYVVDGSGSPVSGAAVTLTAPGSSASGTFAATNTNTTSLNTGSDGLAIASTFAANSQLGSYNVSATVSGLPGSANIPLANAAWFVSTTGNDSNSCSTPGSPCQTINGALFGRAAAGDTIEIASGIYTGSSSTVVTIDKDILLSGGWNASFTAQNGSTIVDGQGVRQGIYINNASATLDHFTVQNGFASTGGGINASGHLTLKNSTITNNTATANAGGIYGGVLVTENATIVNNHASAGGGIEITVSATLRNTILAKNTASNIGPECRQSISASYSLIGDTTVCTVTGTGNITDVDPLLGTFNAAQGYYPLLLGSLAIDNGDDNTCLAKDQLGISRPQGAACDIGAIEYPFNYATGLLLRTFNAGNTITLPGTFVCDQTDLTCAVGDAQAKAAHKYAAGTYDLYKTKFNRNSLDGNGIEILSAVHFGSNYDNAFWNGYMMLYGDKYGFPLADDVVAHELTHGVTQYESNLFYYYQSGAISESLSDVWGEYYDQVGNVTAGDTAAVKWLIGEDVSGLGALRSMSNPSAYNDPDRMTSANYRKTADDNGGVHHNSGVNNKAVYLMVNGGTFNTKTVTALNWEKTAAIYYEASTKLLTSGADYSDLYYALQQACASLIGKNGIIANDCIEVKDAIDAVEMNAQPAANFNTNAPLCSVNSPVIAFSDDLETETANWTFTNGAYPRWQYDSPYGQYAQSGQHFLYADDYPQTNNGVTNASATLKSFVVPNYAYLWFAQAYDFEYDTSGYYDGGVLEYSTNGGATWTDAGSLMEVNGYKGKIYSTYINPLKGRSAFVGTSHGYISTRLNLSTLAQKTVTFRWRMGLDDVGTAWGWWLDNIKVYTCGAATTFADVPNTHPYYNDIEILYANGLTGGCSTGPLKFCPDQIMNRGQAAVFILRGNFGSSYVPPVPTHIFQDDWSKGTWAEPWAEGMKAESLSAGCLVSPPKYCPWDQIPREQAVIFGLRMKYGTLYTPPPATGTVFADMTNAGYYATAWAEQAYKDGIIPNCGMTGGKPNFCPKALVSRGLAAYMIVRAKNLTMP